MGVATYIGTMFQDKYVWITGASSGIGYEMALQFAKLGAHVAVSARREERLLELVNKIKAIGRKAVVVQCDVADPEEVKRAADHVYRHFGRLDIVVANAGFGVGGTIEALEPADWKRQYEVNVIGLVSTIKYALPYLKESKGQIVLMSSVTSMVSSRGTGPYSSSKAAVRTIGQTLSLELEGSGVSCTTIHPGFVVSEIGQVDNAGKYREDWKDRRPRKLMWPTDKAVRAMLKSIKKRERSVVITGHGIALAFIGRHFPGLAHWLGKRFS